MDKSKSLSDIILNASLLLNSPDTKIQDSRDYLESILDNPESITDIDRKAIEKLLNHDDHDFVRKINSTINQIKNMMED